MIDGSFGVEIPTFEFIFLLRVYGTPKVIGVLTHLDKISLFNKIKFIKQKIKHRFWIEIHQGTKMFYFTTFYHGKYCVREVINLAKFILFDKDRVINHRITQSYMLVDQFEAFKTECYTRDNLFSKENIVLFGFLHGIDIYRSHFMHFPGVGDFEIVEFLRVWNQLLHTK